jgi:hypothetical protein
MKIPLLGLEIAKIKKQPVPQSIISTALNELTGFWNELSDKRGEVYRDIDRMLADDEYIAEAADVLLADLFPIKNFYEQIVGIETEDGQLQRDIEEIVHTAQLQINSRNIGYKHIAYQNVFVEFMLQPKSNEFGGIHVIPETWSVYRNVDKHGILQVGDPGAKKPGVCAYDQRDDAGNVIAEWYPWQIVHFRGVPFDKYGYGIPFLKAVRKNWIRLNMLEDHMAIARMVRAYLKIIHHVPVGDQASIEEIQAAIDLYKRSLRKGSVYSLANSLVERSHVNNPASVATDYFMPESEHMKGKIDTIDPTNAQLSNLADVEYFQNKMFARLKVPKARLANERDVNAKATLVEQNTAYASTITGFQIDLLTGFVELVNRALLLKGYDPAKVEYQLTLPSPFVKNELERAQIENHEASAADKYIRAGVLSRDTVRRMYVELDDKESAEEAEKVAQDTIDFPSFGGFGGGGLFASVKNNQIPVDDRVYRELYKLRQEVKNNGHNRTAIVRH